MQTIPTTIKIGIENPFKIIHMSDTHLIYADMRDGERKVILSQKRARHFPNVETAFEYGKSVAREYNTPIAYTGDLIDFVSMANLEAAKDFCDEFDVIMAAGNHEFSLYVGEAKEDAAYRNQSLDTVQKAFKNNIRMSARVINGVNFVALDNGYYLFDEEQLEFLKNEVKRGLPIILVMHTPLYTPELYEEGMKRNPCAYLVGVPEDLMQSYPPERYEQQKADDITVKTVEYIKNEPLIKAILTGHIHRNEYGYVTPNLPQMSVSCEDIRLIEIL